MDDVEREAEVPKNCQQVQHKQKEREQYYKAVEITPELLDVMLQRIYARDCDEQQKDEKRNCWHDEQSVNFRHVTVDLPEFVPMRGDGCRKQRVKVDCRCE